MNRWKNEIRDIVNALKQEDSFVRNSAWMFTSSGVSILIQFIFFPILARIYSPEVYGLFGIFNFYTTTLGNAVTLGYNQAFVIPQKESEFAKLLRLTLLITFALCAALLIISVIMGKTIMSWFEHEHLGNWVYLIVPVALLMALDRITGDWAIRNREFKRQTLWSTITTFVTKIFNVGFGTLVIPSVAGLIWTTLLQHFLRVFFYSRSVLIDFKQRWRDRFSWGDLKEVAKEYKEFPIFIYWGNFINIFSGNIPAALLPFLGFGIGTVGYYSYSLILLDLPIRMLGAGIASVYLQKSSELIVTRRNELAGITWRLFRNISTICLVFLFFMILFGEKVYTFCFGDQWIEAGRAAEVLAIGYYFRMISSPLTALFNVMRRERAFFIFQVFLLVIRVSSLFIGAYFTKSFFDLMVIFSFANAVAYFVLCVWIFVLLKHNTIKVALFTLVSSSIVIVLAYLIKSFF